MHNFCTLFDSNYLPRALVMYDSLVASGETFTLYVVCFDDLAYNILNALKLNHVVATRLADFETEALLAVKSDRSRAEYCWTCTPHVIRYFLDRYQLKQLTYIDADLSFYDKPSILLDELEQTNGSVLITEHRYTPIYDYSKTSGIYCVQFMTFNADQNGLNALQWWQDRCLEWCYARYEDGKFGDQKYLDDWPERFEGVHVLKQLGGGVAPWNVQQYKLSKHDDRIFIDQDPLVFYHFHGYKYYQDGVHNYISGYKLSTEAREYLYQPYSKALLEAYERIRKVYPEFNQGWAIQDKSWRARLKSYKNALLGVANEYRVA
jgi:hypothetical protein